MAKCNHCPRAGQPVECIAESTGHVRLCALVDPTHPDHIPAYVALVAGTNPTISSAEVIRARKAAKPKMALGVKQKTATG